MMPILLQRDERLSRADGRSETNRRNDYQEEALCGKNGRH
jgi:hypothetical protein